VRNINRQRPLANRTAISRSTGPRSVSENGRSIRATTPVLRSLWPDASETASVAPACPPQLEVKISRSQAASAVSDALSVWGLLTFVGAVPTVQCELRAAQNQGRDAVVGVRTRTRDGTSLPIRSVTHTIRGRRTNRIMSVDVVDGCHTILMGKAAAATRGARTARMFSRSVLRFRSPPIWATSPTLQSRSRGGSRSPPGCST
jgi:hypothetical protein